jgi:hypothetical protein
MSGYGKKRAEAAKWIQEHKQPDMWWTWPVLTKSNTAKDTLSFTNNDASLIFKDFEQAGLLLPDTLKTSEGLVGIYRINESKTAEWKAAAHPIQWWVRQHLLAIFWFLVASITSTVIGFLVGLRWEQ